MKFPQAISQALRGVDPSTLPGQVSEGLECAGAKFHSPGPLVLHEVTVAGQQVLLCGTCRDNADVLRTVIDVNRDDLPWRREIGNQMRFLLMPKETDG